jgi:hypothetical protein
MMDQTAQAVADAFTAFPPQVRLRMLLLRTQIYLAADESQTAPVAESLKWGQPSYLTSTGTPIRLGWKADRPDTCQALVHCQTDLISQWRMIFRDAFTYEGTRAVNIPVTEDISLLAFQKMAQMAHLYHAKSA